MYGLFSSDPGMLFAEELSFFVYAHDQRLLSSWMMLLGCARELTRSNCLMQRRTILVDEFHIPVSVKFTIL